MIEDPEVALKSRRLTVRAKGRSPASMSMTVGEAREPLANLAQRLQALGRYL
jgi:hypothetical protein